MYMCILHPWRPPEWRRRLPKSIFHSLQHIGKCSTNKFFVMHVIWVCHAFHCNSLCIESVDRHCLSRLNFWHATLPFHFHVSFVNFMSTSNIQPLHIQHPAFSIFIAASQAHWILDVISLSASLGNH